MRQNLYGVWNNAYDISCNTNYEVYTLDSNTILEVDRTFGGRK